MFYLFSLDLFKAFVHKELRQRMVEMPPIIPNPVVLIRIRLLPEQDILLLQGGGEHHALLVVNVVVMRAMHDQIVLALEPLQAPERRGGVVDGGVVSRRGHVALRVQRVV